MLRGRRVLFYMSTDAVVRRDAMVRQAEVNYLVVACSSS